MDLNGLVILPMTVLLVGAALQGLLARLLNSKAKGWLAFAFSIAALIAVAILCPTTIGGQALDLRLTTWDGPISISYHVDGLAQLFALMGAGIGSAVLLYSVGYMEKDRSATRFYIIMQIFIAGLINLVYTSDLMFMYASWEIVGLCSFLLVSFWYTQKEAAAGARKVLVMTHIAGYALLAAILILYSRTGTTVWTDPQVSQAFTTGIFVLMFISAIAKSVQFPIHTWIASAMAAPTPVSALLHAACYVKAGVYLVARMHTITPWLPSWQLTVVCIGTVTMLVGVLFAMIQHDAKRLLAFHTVSQIGYMMLGLGIGTPLGIIAGLLHCLNHGLFKGGLFLGAGAVQHATGTRDMDKLGGLGRKMPVTAALWILSAGSIAGVPLLNGFVSKWLIYVAALQAGFPIPAFVAWIVSIFTMFSFMKATSSMFFGEFGEASASAHESPRTMLIGSGVLVLGCIVLGVAPQLAIDFLVTPALSGMNLTSNLSSGWLGLTTTGGSFYATTGLVLASVAFLGGGFIWWLSMRSRRLAPAVITSLGSTSAAVTARGPASLALASLGLDGGTLVAGSFTGGEPLPAESRMGASDFSVSIRRGLAPFYKWFDVDRYYLAIWHGTLSVAAWAARIGEWFENHAIPVLSAAAIVIGVIVAATSGVVRTNVAVTVGTHPWSVISAVSIAFIGLLLAMAVSPRLKRHIWLAALSGVLVLASFAIEQEMVRLVALEAAAFVAFALLVATGVERRARLAYLLAVVISAAALVTGTLLLESGPASLVLGLIIAGFAVKLALVPAYLWLPKVAERTPAALVGLIVAVIDVAAFTELIGLRESAAWLFQPTWPWITLGLLSALGGAGLALAQTDIKRFLTFSTITDAGFLVVGLTLAGSYGIAGATAGLAAHAVAKGLLFSCVAAAETDGPFTLATRGAARRHPLAAAGFVAGSLTALGVPPTMGYAGHWRIYLTALNGNEAFLVILIIATILSILAYVRVIALCWWGGDDDSHGSKQNVAWRSIWTSEKLPLAITIVVLTVVVLAAGVWPRML